MDAKRLLTTLALLGVLGLPACGGKQEPQKAPEKSEQKSEKKNGNKEKDKDPVKEGAKEMRERVEDLRVAVRAGAGAAAQQAAAALDAKWEKMEGKVKEKNPEAYEKIERPLHSVISMAGVTPFDQIVIGDQIDMLDEQLAQLSNGSKNDGGGGSKEKKVEMKLGVAAMRYNIQQVGANLEKDTAAAQKAAKDADDAWETFQKEVKQQNEEAYKKIEEAMHNLMAAVQATPLDKKKAAEQVPKLDAELQKLSK